MKMAEKMMPRYFCAEEVKACLPYDVLVPELEKAFREQGIASTPRQHIDMEAGREWLIMPAWQDGGNFGVKLVSVFANNHKKNTDTINGVYALFNGGDGKVIAFLDGAELTARRTAATSVLATKILARPDSKTLVVVGTGKLVTYFVEAYREFLDLKHILIWGRKYESAQKMARQIGGICEPIKCLETALTKADIVSTLTRSTLPIINGEWVRAGTHLDLVGGYRPNMREVDDSVMQKSRIFVDHYDGAFTEAGDIVMPLERNVIYKSEVRDLSDIIRTHNGGRQNVRDITLFKSVGHALEDLCAANLCVKNI